MDKAREVGGRGRGEGMQQAPSSGLSDPADPLLGPQHRILQNSVELGGPVETGVLVRPEVCLLLLLADLCPQVVQVRAVVLDLLLLCLHAGGGLVVRELLALGLVADLDEADLLLQGRHAGLQPLLAAFQLPALGLAPLLHDVYAVVLARDVLLVLAHLVLHLHQLLRDLGVQALDLLELALSLCQVGLQALLGGLGVLQLPALEVEVVLQVAEVGVG
mmetsp:Transcript_27066/g.72129  ORF Transcript_27066/g.72129 Transcript_27066/m.72129 type:complete len:218 (+) Transcript_27066:2-655(+)